MKVKIFTEGGSDIGLGHVSRCSSLYDEIAGRGIAVEFFIYGDVGSIDLLKGRTVTIVDWLSETYLNNNILNTDYCIIDSYLASEGLYQIISNRSKRTLYIDDNARIKYPKGIIVNPSLSVDDLNYCKKNENIYLLGTEFIILRRPFINSGRTGISKNVNTVLITMGGSDLRDLTSKILNGICSKYPEIKFDIVVGNDFHNINYAERIGLNNVELYHNIDAESMKMLMLKSDCAITAAGQTIYELLATQTPFIPIKVAENQSNNIKGLRRINPYQVVIDHNDEFFIEKLDKEFKIILSQFSREILINLYKKQVDGFGSKKIVNCLLREC